MAAKPPTGFLSNLRRAFRERFVIGDKYEPYLPPTPRSTAEGTKEDRLVYRYPAPASATTPAHAFTHSHNIHKQQPPIALLCLLVPLSHPTVAHCHLCPVAASCPAGCSSQEAADVPVRYPETVYDTQFHKRSSIKLTPPPGADEQEFRELAQPGQYPGDYPRHAPHPWWLYDRTVLEAKKKMWKESGGLVSAGAWRAPKDFKRVGPDPY